MLSSSHGGESASVATEIRRNIDRMLSSQSMSYRLEIRIDYVLVTFTPSVTFLICVGNDQVNVFDSVCTLNLC